MQDFQLEVFEMEISFAVKTWQLNSENSEDRYSVTSSAIRQSITDTPCFWKRTTSINWGRILDKGFWHVIRLGKGGPLLGGDECIFPWEIEVLKNGISGILRPRGLYM